MRESRGRAAAAACVVLGALAVAVPAPALSASHRPRPQRQVNATVTGPLTLAWHGDAAHGCAAAGLCGVSGTVQMTFGGASASTGGGPPQLLANDDQAVARVQTVAPDGSATTCTDLVPIQFGLTVHGATAGLATGVGGPGGLAEAPSSGRCAGPTAGEMAALRLPARPDGHGYDFSGHTSFIAGPFAVTVISGVRVRITSGSGGGNGSGPTIVGGSTGTAHPIKLHTAVVEHASLTYRVIGFTGSLTTDFAGAAPPQCEALGACGINGRVVQSFATGGAVIFAGARIARRRVGRSVALADLRGGRMPMFDTFGAQPVRATVNEDDTQTGGVACAAASSAALSSGQVALPHRGGSELVLSDPQDGFGDGPPDPFRTPCPGPATQDVLGPNGGTLATAMIDAGQLGNSHLSITFRAHGVFHSPVYTGRRSGAVTLKLVLVRRAGGTRTVKLLPGEPVLP
jgi:hypothetical protein